jgi:GNAT superfamily N-acetyltransferase
MEQFVRLPWKLYADNPVWIPPLLMESRKSIDKKRNPFYRHSEAEFFLAKKNGELVGRIGAIINHNHNAEHKENIGFFGFFECVNNREVSNALFDAAKSWLKSRGVVAVRGPANPSVNDEYGLLVDGFDHSPVILMPYNPPYYADLIQHAGLKKVKDLYAYHLRQETVVSERLQKVVGRVKQMEGLTFRTLDMKHFWEDINRMKIVYNKAWQHNWGAVPMTNAEFDSLAHVLKSIVDPDLVFMVEYKGEIIGFSLTVPDVNIALKYNRGGRLLPGVFRLFFHKKKINWVRIVVLGVIQKYQKTGAASVLFYETARRGIAKGYSNGEAGWVLEDNTMMNRAAEFLNAERYKTYRLYQADL